MAKVILEFTDTTEGDQEQVALSGSFISEDETKMTPAAMLGFAVKRLFESEWLGKNAKNIVPELFPPEVIEPVREQEESETTILPPPMSIG